ncbi:MAG TPA: hypothetical protein VEC37_07085 [Bacillota bacterium]|nr:hypothetical protein [Bacillota bacterium]
MKRFNYIIYLVFAAVIIISCKEPLNITANPDDHTNASGTLGSAKMTNQLPAKSDNMKIPDTIARKRDSLPR